MNSRTEPRSGGAAPVAGEHPNARVLRRLYADLSLIADYVDDDVVLHSAAREVEGRTPRYRGAQAVRDKEVEFLRSAGGTVRMDVAAIVADDYFGAVTGRIRAHIGDADIAMPFCGLWRFRHGKIVEHWENAYDAGAFSAFLAGRTDAAGEWI